ncbi:InlB B-repeat-containing protein [Bifidobacterium simiiventris]|uniref:InlB B-repeat-containing protein n=1 Tax=Bifidobacterium simiiventris TaxID=2834434 RepID=UPI001C58C5DD|nr:InlB B-repeat-containing protein [Bifidobacterium simiiventris]MBW3079695.1 InlB B-repeat-containing protein [Bifidobacterium simiiventris]
MALSTAVAAPSTALADDSASTSTTQSTAKDPTKAQSDVTVIAFQQSWNTIAAECKATYGPEGVGYIQISPPEESVQGTQWWTVYQPISYSLNSRFGTEDELKNMIQTCNAQGVQIIADVVLNHTSGHDVAWVDDQYGVAGSAYNGTYGRYPNIGDGVYQYEESGNNHQYGLASGDFHSCRTNIADYTNVTEVQECRLSTMWDLNTGSIHVQNVQSDYLAKLWNLGVRGFRIDSAKHMNVNDLKALKARLAAKINVKASDIPFQQEVIYHDGEAKELAPTNYTVNGDVTEFSYAYQLRQDFNSDLTKLQYISNGLLPSDKATVFVANWDSARGSETLNYASGSKYELANAFMLAYDYGKPKILSDYYFTSDNSDAGPNGTTDTRVPDVDFDTACTAAGNGTSVAASSLAGRQQGDWLCQQRWTSIRGMIGFHNAVAGTSVANWQNPGTNNIGFSRYDAEAKRDKGFLAINNTLQEHEETYRTSLPDGTYCNVYTSNATCDKIEVKDGQFTTTIGKRSAVAIYDGMTADKWVGYGDKGAVDSGYDDQPSTGRIGDTSLTIYYKPSTDWGDNVYIQYAAGNALLNDEPVQMTKSSQTLSGESGDCSGADGWYQITIPNINTQRVRYRFTNSKTGGNDAAWDYQDGISKLYETAVGTAIIAVNNHDATIGMPFACVAPSKTTFTVHFAPNSDAQKNATGVVVWGKDVSGKELAEKFYPFGATDDDDGKRMEVTLNGDYTTLNYRIVGSANDIKTPVDGTNATYTASVLGSSDGNDIDGNAIVKVRGSIESWVEGADGVNGSAYDSSYESRHPTSNPQPNDVKNPKRLAITVHYMRADGNYQQFDLDSDTWQGWDLWTWSQESASGAARSFTSHDDYGMVAKYTLDATTTGNRSPKFILRQGGDSWSGKDPGFGDPDRYRDKDRLIPESAIHVPAGNNETGTAEIWLVSGDPTVYTQRPGVVGVTFETGFNWVVSPQAVRIGGKVTPVAENQTPKRDGYFFREWTTDAAGQHPYDFSTPVTGRLKLWAQYDKGNLVTFDTGINWNVSSQTVRSGETVSAIAEIQVPRRDGYRLVGWSTSSDRKVADFTIGTTPVNRDLTLYAVWEKLSYTVTFDTGDGGPAVDSQSVAYGDKVAEPDPAPTMNGKQFLGWTTSADGSTPYNFAAPVTGPLTLYAKWGEAGVTYHLVTFRMNVGEDESASVKSDILQWVAEDDAIAAPDPAPTREGYRLDGWTKDAMGKQPFDFTNAVMGKDDLTLYAKWVQVWTVSFDLAYECTAAGDGCEAPAPLTVDNGSAVAKSAKPADPVRDGYTFEGWYTDADLTEPFVFKGESGSDGSDKPTVVEGDLTLYAKWEKAGKVWTIKFDLNGGKAPTVGDGVTAEDIATLKPQQVYDGEKLVKPTVNPVRDNCTFQGWTTVRDDALASVKDEAFTGGSAFGFQWNEETKRFESIIPIDRNGTLYALWSENSATK